MAKACLWMVLAALWLPAAGDKVDNEEYKAWADAKVGTWCKFKMVSEAAGTKTEMEISAKLLEKTDEKLVLEMKTVMVIAGNKTEMPAQKKEIPAKIDKIEPEGEGMKPKTTEGDEEIEVAGKKLKCHWVETVTEIEGMKTTSKTWKCKDVPGGMVKMTTKAVGADGSVTSDMAMELVEYGTE